MIRILLIEDDPLVVKLYQTIIENAGMEVIIATNGKEGLDALVREKPDLVLCDVMMPGMSGLEVLEKIRESDETAKVKVVMMSNLSGRNDAKLAKDKGANDYWNKKDMEPDQLIASIKALVE